MSLVVLSLCTISLPLFGKELSKAETEYGPAKAVNTYEVLRKGKKIGTHVISFYDADDTLKVVAETNMKVKVLFITAFKYRYLSEETWKDGELLGVETSVNDNGKKIVTYVKREGDNFLINTDDEETSIADDFMTTNHWNNTVINYNALLNTVTGDILDVTINPSDDQDGRFLVRGKLNIDTFYDKEGDWLGMEFEHPKGGRIEFRCIDCHNTPDFSAPRVADNSQAIS